MPVTMKRTIQNLMIAFAGESMARNRYSFFAKKAKEEGYQQIADIFLLTAENEKEHAESVWELVDELNTEKAKQLETAVGSPLPTDNTAANLRSAIEGEKHEHSEMYPEFARVAEEEGLPEAAARLKAIASAEKHHQERYEKLLAEVESGTFFKKEQAAEWVCLECGYVHTGTEPPELCPSCHHDRGYFHIKCEQY